MIRAALVGVSGYGRWHLLMAMEQALVGRLQLVGVTIINPRDEPTILARLQRQGIPVFSSFEDMMRALAGRVDVVLLPTGIQWHAQMTVAALEVGAHVLVEKPAAATLQDLEHMIAVRDRCRRMVAVGFQDLYMAAAHDIKRRLLAGEIGRRRRIVIRAQWPRAEAYFSRNSWAGRVASDGAWVLDSPVSNAYAHFLLLGLFWAGMEQDGAGDLVDLQAELYRVNAIETFDTVSFRTRTDSGIEILFYGSHAGTADRAPEITVIGDAGQVEWVYEREYVVRNSHQIVREPVADQLDTRLTVLENVVTRLSGGDAFIVRPELARGHTLLVNALHEYFAIHDVGPDHVSVSLKPEGNYRRIVGLDDVLADAAARGLLFSEAGVRWGVPARVCSLAGYRHFNGCLEPMAPGAAHRA